MYTSNIHIINISSYCIVTIIPSKLLYKFLYYQLIFIVFLRDFLMYVSTLLIDEVVFYKEINKFYTIIIMYVNVLC